MTGRLSRRHEPFSMNPDTIRHHIGSGPPRDLTQTRRLRERGPVSIPAGTTACGRLGTQFRKHSEDAVALSVESCQSVTSVEPC